MFVSIANCPFSPDIRFASLLGHHGCRPTIGGGFSAGGGGERGKTTSTADLLTLIHLTTMSIPIAGETPMSATDSSLPPQAVTSTRHVGRSGHQRAASHRQALINPQLLRVRLKQLAGVTNR